MEVPPGFTTDTIQDAMPVPGLENTGGVSISDYNREPGEGSSSEAQGFTDDAGLEQGPPATKFARDGSGNLTLLVRTGLERAWPLTGKALANRGIVIDDEDRRRAVYKVRWADPVQEGPSEESLLQSLKFWGDPNERSQEPPEERVYQVAMKSSGNVTRVVIFDEDDQRDRTNSSARLLSRLKRGIQIVGQPRDRFADAVGPIAEVNRDARGFPELVIEEDFQQAWERMARALKRAGVGVTEANRTRGVYSLRYTGPSAKDDEGFLQRINPFDGEDDPNYLLAMRGVGTETIAVIFDADGERETSPVALDILGLTEGAMLAEQEQARRSAVAGPRGPRARVEQDAGGLSQLVVDEEFPQAWRLTGLALDQAGFLVEDRDRTRGVYSVRYRGADDDDDDGEKGFFGRLFDNEEEESEVRNTTYQVALRDDGTTTLVVVFDEEDKRQSSVVATRILNILAERIN